MIPLDVELNQTYNVINVDGNIAPAYKWCIKSFGLPGKRWFVSNHSFYFLQEKDVMLFELRWYG